ncbi:hypothetical protein GUJ93_ZPchr0002g26373 [Zizania palustris]|uniref:Uncharacterized protein n=1 Tax=Zizania palustris TaxID=103762 RepID=A0A8J5RFQ2_ZIZPA|nr:hypothetical protein GUJ93_ZPchr0002g26373 [Zizania palustris]
MKSKSKLDWEHKSKVAMKMHAFGLAMCTPQCCSAPPRAAGNGRRPPFPAWEEVGTGAKKMVGAAPWTRLRTHSGSTGGSA